MLTHTLTTPKHSTRRCHGHCCKLFQITDYSSHEKLWAAYNVWKKSTTAPPGDEEGIHLLAPMLISKGFTPDGSPLFSCKHLSKSGNCTIYEHRPQMCRDLGTINICTNQLCRLKPSNDFWWSRLKVFITTKRQPMNLLKVYKRLLPHLKRF